MALRLLRRLFLGKMGVKNKNVLITGIDGFVGSQLAYELKRRGAVVFGISKKTRGKGIHKVDIVDFDKLNFLFKKLNIQICFHLAGISLVEEGQIEPYETFKVNILGALNILEITRALKLERVIIASTAHVYGDNTPPFKETFFPRPSRPYETSKASVDMISQSYADTFGLPVLIPRFVNIYGPGDTHNTRLIPKTIRAILSDKDPKIWGGDAVRDYLYIDDAIEAYIKLSEVNIKKIGKNRIFNFGSGNKISVKNVVDKALNISGRSLKLKKIKDQRKFEIDEQYVSFGKAKKLLGWEPKVTIDEGLKKTIDWYTHFLRQSSSI